jgi:hypothetical protein
MTRLLCCVLFGLCATPLYGQTRETEPNNAPATATKVELAATAIGELKGISSSQYEVDWWTLEASAGDTLSFDTDAAIPQVLWLELYAADGTTRLDNPEHYLPEVRHIVTKTGTYFVKVSGIAQNGLSATATNYYEIGLYTNRHPKPPCAVADDREPNDVPGTARVITMGRRLNGILCPSGDGDYYRFHATQRMRVQIRVDYDARGKPFPWGNPGLEVRGDGIDQHWKRGSDWTHGQVFEFWVPADGDYYASIAAGGGVNVPYTLTLQSPGQVPQGSGEPIRWVAGNLGFVLELAAGPTGDLYVSTQREPSGHATIVRITPAGTVSTLVPDCQCAIGSMAFDAAGNLFIAGFSNVFKVSPAGVVTPFLHSTNNADDFTAIAFAPDGTLWATSPFNRIRQFGPQGQLLQSIGVGGANPTNIYGLQGLAFAPDGTLHFAAGDAIFRLVGGAPQLFLRDTSEADLPDVPPFGTFTFDAEGNLYVPHPFSGSIGLYDRTGAVVEKPFAWMPGAPRAIAFGRNADGSTNGRIFVLANSIAGLPIPLDGRIVELHSNHVPVLDVAVLDAAAELLHPGRLSAQQLRLLDQQGNRNGRYDVGDLRAFLIANGAKQVP